MVKPYHRHKLRISAVAKFISRVKSHIPTLQGNTFAKEGKFHPMLFTHISDNQVISPLEGHEQDRKWMMSTKRLFYMGIMFSSLDSFPLFINISTYAPYFSVLFFALYLAINHRHIGTSYSRNEFICLLAILLSYGISLLYGVFVYDDTSGFVSFFIQLTIAIVLYKSFNTYFRQIPTELYTERFARVFIKYNIPILAIGILEIMLMNNHGVYDSFVSLFSWRTTLGRIQLVSGEPAWASRLLLTMLALIPLARYGAMKTTFLTITSSLLLLATGSSLGILCAALYYLITYFKRRYIKYYITCAIFLSIMAPIIYNSLSYYTKSRLELLSQLSDNNIETLAVNAGSGSVMARIGNPIVGAYVGLKHPITGVGGGYYYQHHFDNLAQLFPSALSIPNVYETGTTPKNLLSRVFAETGLLGLLPLLFGLMWIYKHIISYNKQLLGVFICMLLLTINFDTLFHIYPLLLFCFLINYPYKQTTLS